MFGSVRKSRGQIVNHDAHASAVLTLALLRLGAQSGLVEATGRAFGSPTQEIGDAADRAFEIGASDFHIGLGGGAPYLGGS
jgi:hypothetical protein